MAKPYFVKADQNKTVYEFMPFKGDPTMQEQIEAIEQYKHHEEDKARAVLQHYKKMKLKV